MKGIVILLHAVRLVFNNLDMALRVTLLPYAALVALNTYTASLGAAVAQISRDAGPESVPSGLILQIFLFSLVALVLTLWVTVAWHRYVLTGEAGPGLVPKWTADRVAAYFVQGFLIMLLIALVGGLLLLVLDPILPPVLAVVIAAFWALVLFYRLCAVLPAAAIGEKLTLSQAWEATKGQSSTIIMLSLVGAGLLWLLELPNMMGDGGGVIGFVYSAVIGWFTMVIGISVISTFYGHFVDGRPID